MPCKYNHDEFCVNDQCPMCADYCPVPDIPGVCQYEEREEERYTITPKGCLAAALYEGGIDVGNYDFDVGNYDFDVIWDVFTDLMVTNGWVQEDE